MRREGFWIGDRRLRIHSRFLRLPTAYCLLLSAYCPSRRFPIEGVDFLDADIMEDQGGIVRGQAHPGTQASRRAPVALQAHHSLHLSVSNTDTVDSRFVCRMDVEVDKLPIPRPAIVTGGKTHELRPLLVLHIEEEQLLLVYRLGHDIAAIGRPARSKEPVRAGQGCNPLRLEIKHMNGGTARCFCSR